MFSIKLTAKQKERHSEKCNWFFEKVRYRFEIPF